jgi:hypothetical protein
VFNPLTLALVLGLLSTLAAHTANCLPINDPEPHAGMETFKEQVFAGDIAVAMKETEIPPETQKTAVDQFTGVFNGPAKTCVTLARTVPSEHWINEVIMFESQSGSIVYLLLAGQTMGDEFRLIYFNLTGKFSEIREFVF